MFNLFRKKVRADGYSSLLAEKTLVTGRVKYSGAFRIDGTVEGDVIPFDMTKDLKGEHTLIIGETGIIDANFVRCIDAVISGTVKAKKLIVHGTLQLEKTAKLTNVNIFYSRLQIAQGAYISDCHLTNIADTNFAQPKQPDQPADK